jgi:hypothetical protein
VVFEVFDRVLVSHLFHTSLKLNKINDVIIEWE